MTLRYKLTLNYLWIIAVLLVIFCACIYIQGEIHRRREFENQLSQEAITASTVFFKENEISPEILKILDRNNLTALYDEEIIIFDQNHKILYESGKDKLVFDTRFLGNIKEDKDIFWSEKKREFCGKLIKNNNSFFYIISSGIDKYGLIKQKNLAYMLIIGCISLILISSLVGWLFVKQMLKPIKHLITKIDNIKASQLNFRLSEGNKDDELAQLSTRFNRMLDRLEKAFITQKAFVSNASHELRTPLTSITGQIQVSLLAKDSSKDLKLMISSVLEDVRALNKLSNNLLDLTSIDGESYSLSYSLVNILDKISRVRNEVMKQNPYYKVFINFEEQQDLIPELKGNAALLYTAFFNLIENGVKYSLDKTVKINIENQTNGINITLQNKSNKLTENELTTIFEPFMRGSNSKLIKGHGIGLSLTQKIILLHKGTITFDFTENQCVLVSVFLPK
jgi:signal transduction histidine kinase